MKISKLATMKLTLLTMTLLTGSSIAGFETWTNPEGKKVELDLISKKEEGSKIIGVFRARNGRTVEVSEDKLSAESIERLKAWTPAAGASTEVAEENAFTEIFDGNLLALSGKNLKKAKDVKTPAKYYVFYYTASWCGPCQKFTPSLVEFYNKEKNDDFELVLITSDSNEDAMEGYAQSKQMPWPHLKLSKVEKFKKQFPNRLGGIPAIVVTELDGKVVAEGNAYSVLPKLKTIVSK